MNRTSGWLDISLLLTWSGFLFVYGIDGELYRTEGLRALVAEEYLREGQWAVPTLYGQPLLTKPPGMYLTIALVSWPMGRVTEWSARLPSACAATITVLLFYWYFRRHLGRAGGLLAAFILPISVFWLDKAPSAEIDMLQLAWVSAALLFFLRGLETKQLQIADCRLQIAGAAITRKRISICNLQSAICNSPFPWWLLSLLCVAGGVLTKWTAVAFFYGTVVPLLCWRRQLRCLWRWEHLLAAVLGGAACLGWAAWAASVVGWETFWSAVSSEALQHLSPGHHQETVVQLGANHRHKLNYWGNAVTFPLLVLAMSLPWSVLALLSLRPGFYRQLDDRGQFLLQALHCWTWPNLLLWTLLPDPSPRHAAPLLPGIAGLAALVLASGGRSQESGIRSQASGAGGRTPLSSILNLRSPILAVAILWIGVKVAFVELVVPARMAQRQPRAKGEQVAACVPADQTLYLFRLKDEGLMFYYGRPVRRLQDPAQLPSPAELVYCILSEAEFRDWRGPAEVVLRLQDQQQDPVVLIRTGTPGTSASEP